MQENEPHNLGYSPGEQITEPPQPEAELPLPTEGQKPPSRLERLKDWYLSRKKLTIPATVILLAAMLAGIPFTRYKAAGLVIKQDFAIKVIDSGTKSPVSEAVVSAGSITATTDGDGQAILKNLPVGTRSLTITKKHYKDSSSSFLIPIMDQKKTPTISLIATGRQVAVKAVNYVNGNPLAKVHVQAGDIEATTDKDGQALLVLPANQESYQADLSLDGYLKAKVELLISDQLDETVNTFKLVPSGHVYFMSKRTGKLDLMRSNIDGSGAEVVIAGTGHEQDYRTSLVPSADFKHIVLLTKRSAGDPTPQLYIVIEGKLQAIETGNTEFYVHGWAGDNLIYTASRNDVPNWQQGKHKLKSYDADSGKITLLDQSAGSDEATNAGENYTAVAITGSLITYAKSWLGYYYGTSMAGRQHSLHTIGAGGQNHKLVTSFDAEKYSLQYRQKSPNSFYIYQYGDDVEDTYFEYTIGSQPKQISLDYDKFYESYPMHIISPDNQKSVWSDLRDGNDVVLVGDNTGGNAKIIASLDEYGVYGWFQNDYILLTKENSELYIMSVDGGEPLKITDYQSVNGAYIYY